jgi:hypothetical protein
VTVPLEQLTVADLAHMTPAQIDEARETGRLARLLGVPDGEIALIDKARTGVINGTDAGALNKLGRHDLVDAAREDGRIDFTNQED